MEVLIWLAFLSPSILLAGFWLRMRARAAASQNWSATTGRVTFVWPGPRYPSVKYTYTVAGREFNGKRIWFGEKRVLMPKHSKDVPEKYRKDETVVVYYNPAKPGDSVLERRAYAPYSLIMALVWLICIGQALVLSKR